MNWYVQLLSNRPHLVILVSGTFSILALVLSLTVGELPDFSDPQAGFESRGTEISDRLVAWSNLLDSVSHVGPLISNPNLLTNLKPRGRKRKRKEKKKNSRVDRFKRDLRFKTGEDEKHILGIDNSISVTIRNQNGGKPQLGKHLTPRTGRSADSYMENRNAWLCGDPVAEYVHVVYESMRGESLFTMDSILSMCRLESVYLKTREEFNELCETKGPADCCPGWSLGGYIALLFNRTSCFTIQESDVDLTLQLAKQCFPHYKAGRLTAGCLDDYSDCTGVPVQCVQHNAIFTILHFLTDQSFPDEQGNLKYAISFLPLARSSAMMPFYGGLDGVKISDGRTQIVAMDLGLKDALFNRYLLQDAHYLLLSLTLIFFSVWVFTSSLTITLASLSAILFSLVIAYFIYTFIFNLSFFPFMNILAVIIALGVGTDDTFILAKVWTKSQQTFKKGNEPDVLEDLVNYTLCHASLSMLVTSITTAAAFFGSIVSNITAIKCFSIFAGLTILTNLLLMLSWVPAWMVLHHKLMNLQILPETTLPPALKSFNQSVLACYNKSQGFVNKFYDTVLPCVVIRPKILWIILLGSMVVLSSIVLFYLPGLRLPASDQLQLFTSSHPFEIYDFKFRNMFDFEKSYQKQFNVNMPLRFVWGVQDVDNGNHLNPGDRGMMRLDSSFDISTKEAQSWMFKFCQELKRQPFYKLVTGRLQLSNCFIQTFRDWMSRPCHNDLSKEDHRPCCRESHFPFPPTIFNQCLQLAVEDLYETPSDLWLPGVAGPKFDIISRNVSAIIIEFESNQLFSFKYAEMQEFYLTVDKWFKEILVSAPAELSGGWFSSYLEFFDLQQSLLQGTYIAIIVAMLFSFVVLLVATQNLVLSMFAIATVFSIIMVTVAILLLLGWELNILESVVVSLAIGLSVDFTLHYGIMYKLAVDTEREACVNFSLSTMGSPVSMGAFTTFLAGVVLLPSRVLAYIQIGTFITILMVISWIFSTIFFQAILGLWGPQEKSTFTLPYLEKLCCTQTLDQEEELENKQAYTVSDSVLTQMSNSNISYKVDNSPEMLLRGGNGNPQGQKNLKKRCFSYSKPNENNNSRLVEGGGGARSKSCDLTETPLTLADTQLTMLEDQQEIDDEVCEITATETELGVTVTTTVATLHTVPSFRTSQRGFMDSPGRRSIDEIGREVGNRRPIDEPMFVSDGQTIRSDPFHIQSLKKSGGKSEAKSKSCEDGECCPEGRGINGKGEGKGSKVKVENGSVLSKGNEDIKESTEKNEAPGVNTPNGLHVVDLCEEVDLGLGEEDHVPGQGNGVDLLANAGDNITEAEDIRPAVKIKPFDGAPCPPPHLPLDKAKMLTDRSESPPLSCPLEKSTKPVETSGAIPKYSRKKSLPESAFTSGPDIHQQPYQLIGSPRSCSNSSKKRDRRPKSSFGSTPPQSQRSIERRPKSSASILGKNGGHEVCTCPVKESPRKLETALPAQVKGNLVDSDFAPVAAPRSFAAGYTAPVPPGFETAEDPGNTNPPLRVVGKDSFDLNYVKKAFGAPDSSKVEEGYIKSYIAPASRVEEVKGFNVSMENPSGDGFKPIDNIVEHELGWNSPKTRNHRDLTNQGAHKGSLGTGAHRSSRGLNSAAEIFDTNQPLPPIRHSEDICLPTVTPPPPRNQPPRVCGPTPVVRETRGPNPAGRDTRGPTPGRNTRGHPLTVRDTRGPPPVLRQGSLDQLLRDPKHYSGIYPRLDSTDLMINDPELTYTEQRSVLRIDQDLDYRSLRMDRYSDRSTGDHKHRRDQSERTVMKDQDRVGKRSSNSVHQGGEDTRYTEHMTNRTNQDEFKRRSSLRRHKVEESSLKDKRQDRDRSILSKSTETILLRADEDPIPILPNKKTGTPDVWVLRTLRA